MFDKARLFTARALFALIAVLSLGLGLLVAGIAVVIGLLLVAALRIAMGGAGRSPGTAGPSDAAAIDGAPQMPQASSA